MTRTALLGGMALFLLACSKPDTELLLIYSGNLDGELEPCGCSDLGNFGGIRRRATTLENLRKQNPHAALISAGGLVVSETGRDRLKSQYILKGFKKLNYDAIGVQWQDLVYGEKFLTDAGLPWVASNWRGEDFSKSLSVNKPGGSLAMFTWLDPSASPFKKMRGDFGKVSDQNQVLAQQIIRAKQAGAITLLTSSLPLDKAKSIIPLENVDILIVEANYEEYVEPKKLGNTLILQAGSRGMRLGKLLLKLKAGRKIKSWQHEVVPMPDTVPNHPDLEAWYAEYNDRVKQAYLKRVALRKAQNEGNSPFAGADSCAQCHQKEHSVWEKTKHAQAFKVLEEVKKEFDPDCLQCHTVGFNTKGGYVDKVFTDHLMHVQCESCHGAGREHAESGGQSPVANKTWTKKQICEQCHNHAHSPGFKYENYWPKIVHGSLERDRTAP